MMEIPEGVSANRFRFVNRNGGTQLAPAGTSRVSGVSRSVFSGFEEEQVVELAQLGYPDATDYLLTKYRGFVESKARSYFLAGAEFDDVVQEGMIGLYKAVRDFRPDREAKFRSFVELCVTRQMITAVKAATRNKHAALNDYVSLQRSGGGEESDWSLVDVLADTRSVGPEQMVIDSFEWRRVNSEAGRELSMLEREVLRKYLAGRSYREIAGRLRRSPKTIDNALQRARRKVGQCIRETC